MGCGRHGGHCLVYAQASPTNRIRLVYRAIITLTKTCVTAVVSVASGRCPVYSDGRSPDSGLRAHVRVLAKYMNSMNFLIPSLTGMVPRPASRGGQSTSKARHTTIFIRQVYTG